jgi:hypothetical protein
LRTHISNRNRRAKLGARLGALLLIIPLALALPTAQAGSGGTSSSTGSGSCGKQAKIRNGLAVAPDCAPSRIKDVIDKANKIAKGHDYCMGGGHGDWKSPCYDCSGSVSYALHGGNFVKSPMDSSGFMHWAKSGKGDWFTVYSNSSHVWLKIAGLRFDTADTKGKGPGWADNMGWEKSQSYHKRHKSRY